MNIKIRQFKRGEQVAPHKPLLLLIAIARLQSGEPRLLTYQEIEPNMNELLLKYTKSKGKPHPEFPFWRLRNDMNGELWEIPSAPSITQNDHGDVSPRQLIALKIKAGFTLTVFEQLKNDPAVAATLAQNILDEYFPDSLHEDIKNDIGLLTTIYQGAVKRKRDPSFSRTVLEMYRYQCVICSYGARLGHAPMGLEAAHIKWHAYNGPDIPTNGLALCSLHHKAFDSGAIGISDDAELIIAKSLNGSGPLETLFFQYQGKTIFAPDDASLRPAKEFIQWHRKEVFRG